LPFPPPYVVKLLSPDLPHRSEFGGIVLDIETITSVRLAVEAVTQRAAAARPDAFIDGVLIARRETGLAEVLLGFHRDPEAGPVVTLAMGGIMTEIYGDKSVRLAPVDRPTAFGMIDEVKGLAGIRGYRNRPRGDLEALATAIMAFSSFALLAAPRVESAEINPLLVKAEGGGVVALDGLIATE
jgi:succinyl-CoA synthetase beta subunit